MKSLAQCTKLDKEIGKTSNLDQYENSFEKIEKKIFNKKYFMLLVTQQFQKS